MKILVTGGTGFMGSEFVRQAIKRGFEIVILDKITYAGDLKRLEEVDGKYKLHKVDIANFKDVKDVFDKEKPSKVVHFAAETHVDRSIVDSGPFIDTNVKGTQNMLDAARQTEVEKFINLATDEVYGALGENGQFYEDTPLNPNSPYATSKAAADMLGRAFFKTYGTPVVTVRPCNYYGPWQYPEKVIPVMILKALKNEPLPVYGKGENVREWLHISDCAEAIFQLLEKGTPGEAYNIGSGEERKNIDLVKIILKVMGKSEDLISFVKDRPGHDFRYSLNTDKIKKEIGWEPKVRFSDGIESTVKWNVDNKDWVESKMEELKSYWEKETWKK